MTATPAIGMSSVAANHLLGRTLDSIPFSVYHVLLIAVLGFVGFVEGYDLAVTDPLLVLARTLLFGRETLGQLVIFTEAVPA